MVLLILISPPIFANGAIVIVQTPINIQLRCWPDSMPRNITDLKSTESDQYSICTKMNESNTPCSLYQNINTHSIQINGNCCITFVIFT